MTSSSSSLRSLLRRFALVSIGVVVTGLGLALVADRKSIGSDQFFFENAAREIGDALVAGGVVALLVVWFETSREQQRSRWEEERNEERFAREEDREQQRATAEEQREARRMKKERAYEEERHPF